MNSWTGKIIIVGLAIAFVPLLAAIISKLVAHGVHVWTEWITNVFSGGAGLEGIVKLCIYLIAITLLVKYLSRPRSG